MSEDFTQYEQDLATSLGVTPAEVRASHRVELAQEAKRLALTVEEWATLQASETPMTTDQAQAARDAGWTTEQYKLMAGAKNIEDYWRARRLLAE